MLDEYFESDKPQTEGFPTVAGFASNLNLSSGYFGDLIKKQTGKSAQEYKQNKIIDVAKTMIFDGRKMMNEIAFDLGFKYPQHFNRLFKQRVGFTPNEYRNLN